MKRYKIWDKKSDIFTLGAPDKGKYEGKRQWTAEEYISINAPWADNPNVKIIVGGGYINGTVFMEYESTVLFYKNQGANINDTMTDEEVLSVIELFEDTPQPSLVTSEERIAAALEFMMIMDMPDM